MDSFFEEFFREQEAVIGDDAVIHDHEGLAVRNAVEISDFVTEIFFEKVEDGENFADEFWIGGVQDV